MEFLNFLNEEMKHTYQPNNCNSTFKIKDIFIDHWDAFLEDNPNLNIRPIVYEEVQKMMNCGSLSNGYTVYTCDHCNNYLYVPFTCKSRFCCSCGTKYTLDRADTIAKKSINCPHRHITFTIHHDLWPLFQKIGLYLIYFLMPFLLLFFHGFLNKIIKKTLPIGFIATLHTFGRDLKWNPHIHVLITEFVLVGTLFTLTILFKRRIILLEGVILLNIKRPKYTEFICPNCKCHENIPTNIVLQMDMMDPGDPIYPPMFDCEKCGTQ